MEEVRSRSRSAARCRRLLVVGALLAPALVASAAEPPEPTAEAPEPAPFEWLIDEHGRQYRVEKLPKSQPHRKLEDGRLRTVWGFTAELLGEDAEHYLIKVYRTDHLHPKRPVDGPSAEERAAIEDSYRFTLSDASTLSFEEFDRGLPRRGQWRHGFALADMNGDGLLDLVHGRPRKGPAQPMIFLSDGRGGWHRWEEASFPDLGYDYGDVAVADFDGDGLPDLALAMHLRGVVALRNLGGGRFAEASDGMDPLGPDAFSARRIEVLDADGDGRPDLAALGEGPRMRLSGETATPEGVALGIRIYRNRGDFTWQPTGEEPPSGLFGDALVVASVDDGRLGLIAGSSRLGGRDLLFAPAAGAWRARRLEPVRPVATVGALAVADVDADGRQDLVLGYRSFEGGLWRSGLDLALREPDGGWSRRTLYTEESRAGFTALDGGDLDRDGRPDLVAGTGDGRLLVLLNDGDGAFHREEVTLTEAAGSCRCYHLEIADLDGDGGGDLVAALAGEAEGLDFLGTKGCPGEGSLRAWRVRPLGDAAAGGGTTPGTTVSTEGP